MDLLNPLHPLSPFNPASPLWIGRDDDDDDQPSAPANHGAHPMVAVHDGQDLQCHPPQDFATVWIVITMFVVLTVILGLNVRHPR